MVTSSVTTTIFPLGRVTHDRLEWAKAWVKVVHVKEDMAVRRMVGNAFRPVAIAIRGRVVGSKDIMAVSRIEEDSTLAGHEVLASRCLARHL